MTATVSLLFWDNYRPCIQENAASRNETYKFTGKPVSATTGLYYEYHRWYDPSVGRFVSEDSLPSRLSDPQSSNKYGYVNNAPTTFTDPSGLGMIVGNGRLPCWDWFGLIPCHQGGTAGAVSTVTTTSSAGGPEGPLIAIGVIGIYVGGSALYNFLANYFARNPPSTTNPGVGGNDGSDRTTPSPTSSSTGRIGTGPTIRVPGLSTGMMGQSTLFGTRIAVDNPILDPYRPRNTSMTPPSRIAKYTCAAATLIGVGIGLYADEQSARLDLVPPSAGALFLGGGCISILWLTH